MENARSFPVNYVLIDFENVHPKNMSMLSDDHFRIRLFLGAKQSRLDVDIVEAMHNFGPQRAKYIQITEVGKNALDFCITYYLGELVAENPRGYFHIISKDKGFDPLIAHLNSRGIHVRRHVNLMDIPIIGIARHAEIAEKAEAAWINLQNRGVSKPRKEKTLKNTLKHMFKDELTDDEASRLFNKLIESKRIMVDNEKITYNLSA